VVEDDRAARRAIKFILKTSGFSVTEAGTVAEAMGALAQRPDWVLLDLMLPDGCGTDVLRKLRAEGPPSRVCVITGCGPQKLEEVRVLGPDLILKKPLDVEGLLAALNSEISASPRIEPESPVR
jgi:DNA-binding response OmpR family regulator